ncbi:hypothetical protein D1AOALGA4SA_12212 [Olavius algarvensis Delta 1 endosymbiont]|nr:hypothetical protein D1AOALGA4SA_12212 [Olavius algarvensis Delta 1 endosymbiont]
MRIADLWYRATQALAPRVALSFFIELTVRQKSLRQAEYLKSKISNYIS